MHMSLVRSRSERVLALRSVQVWAFQPAVHLLLAVQVERERTSFVL